MPNAASQKVAQIQRPTGISDVKSVLTGTAKAFCHNGKGSNPALKALPNNDSCCEMNDCCEMAPQANGTSVPLMADSDIAPIDDSTINSFSTWCQTPSDEEEGRSSSQRDSFGVAGQKLSKSQRSLFGKLASSSATTTESVSMAQGSFSYRKRWLSARADLAFRLSKLAVSFVLVVLAAALAVLITFWALFPVCTSCLGKNFDAGSVVKVAGSDETGWSNLHINQLQVRMSIPFDSNHLGGSPRDTLHRQYGADPARGEHVRSMFKTLEGNIGGGLRPAHFSPLPGTWRRPTLGTSGLKEYPW